MNFNKVVHINKTGSDEQIFLVSEQQTTFISEMCAFVHNFKYFRENSIWKQMFQLV